MAIPQFDTSNPQMISQGPSVCVFNKEDSQEVLASWLFAQYLLTNEVQIAYAETEGYVPVTSRAQESPEYQEYLAGCGEDNALHYEVKIKATKLYSDMASRHHLDQLEQQGSSKEGKSDLGPLPVSAVLLLSALAGAWALMLAYIFFDRAKKKEC